MNYMEQVAQMLGVELGEEFYVDVHSDIKYKFTEKYLVSIEPDGYCQMAMYTFSDLLNGTYKLIKIPKSVLDKKEKEYLKYLIRPFRKKVKYVKKHRFQYQKNYEYLQIVCRANHRTEFVEFPSFKEGMMYQGMELEKEYTLDELGI